MSQFPRDDDEHVVEFLRLHRPEVPPAAPDLEDQIMQAVAASPQPQIKRRHLWVVPPAIAAGMLIAWAGYYIYTPAPDTATLEAFIENSWNGTMGEGTESEASLLAILMQ